LRRRSPSGLSGADELSAGLLVNFISP